MKPLQIGLLVVAGALGGALIMKYSQGNQPESPAVATQQPEAPAAAPAPALVPPPAAEPAPPAPVEKAAASDKPKPSEPVHTARVRRPAPKPRQIPAPFETVRVESPAPPAVVSAPPE